jgi:hypothetical protein
VGKAERAHRCDSISELVGTALHAFAHPAIPKPHDFSKIILPAFAGTMEKQSS